ncbi:hypothetical protein HALDL1_16590 [Halobacterium sp. DL1]|jgi:hypothetical protein|nr:hypothetical protein HALDL1_16590 [Halobacterium sp. DL1]
MSDSLEEVWASHESSIAPEEVDRACAAAGDDQVVCRECAQALGQITEQHLRTHDTTLAEYKAANPGAPIYPADAARQPGREPGFSHPDETKRKIAESTKRNHRGGVYE